MPLASLTKSCVTVDTVPPTMVRSALVKSVGTSLNTKVTTELMSVSFKPASAAAIVTATLGLSVSTGTVALPPAPTLPTASV